MSNKESLPLMAEEEVQLSFGDRHGLKMKARMDRNTMVLTDRRLIRLSRVGSNWQVLFVSLEDAQVAEVRITSRSKRPLLRAALLLAGAGAALAAIDFLPISLVLAAALGLGGGYHLFHYLTVSLEGSILFRAGTTEMVMPFQGDMGDQAYTFVNRFSLLKASYSPASKVVEEPRNEAQAPSEQARQETGEVAPRPAIERGGGNPGETREEGFSQAEQAKSRGEEAKPSQPSEQVSNRPHGTLPV